MKPSIRWVKMFEQDGENWVDLEHILPVWGHLYVVGTQWAYVNMSWVHAFPYTKTREWITNTPHQLQAQKMEREEYIRQQMCEPVEKIPEEPRRYSSRGIRQEN